MPILFDLDDTLLDDRQAQQTYLSTLYTHHRTTLPYDDLAGFSSAWRSAIQRHFARYLAGELTISEQRRLRIRDVFGQPHMSDREVDPIVSEFMALYAASWCLFPDVTKTLAALASCPLGIITNGSPEQQLDKLARTGIRDHFAVVIVSESVGHAKPAPEIFQHACSQLRCAPADCTFVGDDWGKDVEGALGAGMTPIWLNRHGALPPTGSAGVTTISTLLELLQR